MLSSTSWTLQPLQRGAAVRLMHAPAKSLTSLSLPFLPSRSQLYKTVILKSSSSATKSCFHSERRSTVRTPNLKAHLNLSTSSYTGGTDLNKAGDSTGSTYTTAYAFFDALWELGVEYCFVNVGADHPSVIEAMVKGQRERPDTWPRMITCPSEMVAISMADGYGRITGKPQAVIVHVDVGTQALAHGVHNASLGRVPILIFAGLCPFTEAGELTGSRTEYMHWLQEPPDQKAIVRQYCRYVGEVKTGLNVKQNVARALQFAKSDPKGPSYLVAAREVLAQEIEKYELNPDQWTPIEPTQLPMPAVKLLADALVNAKRPLVITGYSGRNVQCPSQLVRLADNIPGLRVFDVGGSDVCFPASHPAFQGFRLGVDDCIRDADVILVLDCDVPWIPTRSPPPKDAQIFQIDVDPLNQHIPVSFFPANGRWRADVELSLMQINEHLETDDKAVTLLKEQAYDIRQQELVKAHQIRMDSISKLGQYDPTSSLDGSIIGSILREHLARDVVYVVEAVTCSQLISDQLQPETPGSWINTGATGIGWSNGAVLGVKLALDDKNSKPSFVVQLVGDGSYLCGSPASSSWVASRYGIPVLTIVLNNGGWVAPRNSTRLVYPNGLNVNAAAEELNISFKPSPNYAEMAKAAAGDAFDNGTKPAIYSARVEQAQELIEALRLASKSIGDNRGAFIEAILK